MTRGRRRGWIVALAALAAADAIVVALRQTGIIRRLPEPPGRIWDTNRVVTAPVAYAMGVPDAPIAAVVYLSMIGFAARLGRRQARRRPWSALGLAAGATGAAAGAAFYLWDMLAREKKLCPYCLGTATASFTLLPLAMPELGDALRLGDAQLLDHRRGRAARPGGRTGRRCAIAPARTRRSAGQSGCCRGTRCSAAPPLCACW